MSYVFDEATKTLDLDVPLIEREALLTVCKEIDSDTPEAETDSFISSAHIMLAARLDGYGLPEALLTKIELYLAAHFAVLSYPAVQRETLGPMSTSYVTKVDLGLKNTKYGQAAVAMDPIGKLSQFDKKRVKMYSLGSGIEVTQ